MMYLYMYGSDLKQTNFTTLLELLVPAAAARRRCILYCKPASPLYRDTSQRYYISIEVNHELIQFFAFQEFKENASHPPTPVAPSPSASMSSVHDEFDNMSSPSWPGTPVSVAPGSATVSVRLSTSAAATTSSLLQGSGPKEEGTAPVMALKKVCVGFKRILY